VLVDQYRRGLGAVSRELPAGVIEPGESPLAAAQRELREETGHEARAWIPLGAVSPEPSRSTAIAHLFVAQGAHPVGEQRLDEEEDLVVRVVPLAEALGSAGQAGDGAGAGGIVHGTHLAALFLAQRRGLLG
jgi:8-oxo-dGTP pyrophosphatase MutT (NUDIX family)